MIKPDGDQLLLKQVLKRFKGTFSEHAVWMNGQVAEFLNLCALISEALLFFTSHRDRHACPHTYIIYIMCPQPTMSLKINTFGVGRYANQQAVEMLKSTTDILQHYRAMLLRIWMRLQLVNY